MDIQIDSCAISAQHRKLKAIWSQEAQQDLRVMHNLNSGAILSDILSKEIVNEMDQEILYDLSKNADHVTKQKQKKRYRSIDDPWDNE